jgi:hypothetical protein
MSQEKVIFGVPAEWRAFHERHPEWEEVQPRLKKALEHAFIRQVAVDEKGRHVIFALGRLAVEDFAEILLLCGNGYGVGGLKILRGMYERVVTALYLARHPEQVDAFLDYHYIHQRKLLNHATGTGINLGKHETEIAAVEAEYQRVKGRYQGKGSWTKLDLKTMADEVALGHAYGLMHFWPTLMHHTTLAGVNVRYEQSGADVLTFLDGPQQDETDQALGSAHALLLILLQQFDDLFKLGLPNLNELHGDFARCWKVAVAQAGH